MNKGQIISLQGDESQWYKQAVFVMKDEVVDSYRHKDLRQEADRIIGNYVKQNGIIPMKPSKKIDTTLNLILWGTICILGIGLCLL